jgi:hypothetical protein
MSLVSDLQKEALNNRTSVLDLLNKAFAVAKKLNLEKFEKWTELELEGYKEYDDLPTYRFVQGVLKYRNPFHGWCPLIVDDEEIYSKITHRPVNQPISEIQALIDQGEKQKNYQLQTMPQGLELFLRQNLSLPDFELSIHIDPSQMKGVLEAVRKKILTWSLELEKMNVKGDNENFSFSEKEIRIADDSESKLFNLTFNFMQQQEGNMTNQKNDWSNVNIGNFANEVKDNARQQAKMQINQENDQEIKELASDLNNLLEQVSQNHNLETISEKRRVATEAIEYIEQNQTLMKRVSEAFKTGTLSGFEKLLDHPVASFLTTGIQELLQSDKN